MAQSPMFINNKYTRWYYSLCERGRTRTINEYTESHHIIPESFFSERTRPGPKGWLPGNPNDPSNLTDLTDREHELAHYLLTKMCRDNKRAYFKVLKAYEMRSLVNKNQVGKRHFSSRRLAGIRAERARIQSEMTRGENNPNWGKTWSDEQKQAQADKVRGEKNGAKSESARRAMSELKTGVKREAFSQEWLDAMSDAKMGEKNNRYGVVVEESTKALISAEISKYAWVNDGIGDRRVLKTEVDYHIKSGMTRGRVNGKKTGERQKIECPHCGTLSAANTYARFHGDKCRHKK